jgi:spoIIIJ-associated protein
MNPDSTGGRPVGPEGEALDPRSERDPEREQDSSSAEGEGESLGEAKWSAMKELERRYPGIDVEHVEFTVLEQRSGEGFAGFARVAATADLRAWRAAEREFTWPGEPADRVREILGRVIAHLGLRASVDVEETADELRASISGPELGLLIGKHGQTIDALQFLCSQAAFRGFEERKHVILDAGGYRERRQLMLHRQADRGAADALRYGRAVELDAMAAAERKVVHLYLKDRPEVETHSEGDEPFRRIVITPLRRSG